MSGELHDTRCPQCGKFVPVDADGYYDSDDKRDSGQPEMVYGHLATFCTERCACMFHGRPVPRDYWRPGAVVMEPRKCCHPAGCDMIAEPGGIYCEGCATDPMLSTYGDCDGSRDWNELADREAQA